jgi:hypothetical protein
MNSPERSEVATGKGNDLNTLQSTRKDIQFTDRYAIAHLKELHIADSKIKHPQLPYYSSPDFSASTTNGLTKAVIHFLMLKGHQSERISSAGRYINNSITSTNVMNQRVKIGSGCWIPGTSKKGSADISSTINSMSVKWEIKNAKTRDRQSEAQKRYQAGVEASLGVYVIVTSFAQFVNWFYLTFGGAKNE